MPMTTDWRERLDANEHALLRQERMPEWTAPMLATLTDERFSSPEWIYERKLDGVRCLAFRRRGRVAIYTRNRNRLNDTYPELEQILLEQPREKFIVDGEIVAFKGNNTSFSRLQKRSGIGDREQARASGVKVYLYLFDLLFLDGSDITALPLRARKGLLLGNFEFDDGLRYSRHRNTDGEDYYQDACKKGWEGLIAKRADAPYRHGRSRDWLKFKCVNRQELVICGYTDPQGSRKGFGALLLGYYEGEELRYAGRVGTGFDRALLESLAAKLEASQRPHSPYADMSEGGQGVHWVAPEMVAEIGFTEWTRDGRLRHPRFIGLRDDKCVADVVREEPASNE
jgi:DNA ligase D-like protein (predicted ligase)